MEFYTEQPIANTAWRLAVLMGANARTYKFALATSLLHHAGEGRTDLTLQELARPYAMSLVEHLQTMPQVPSATPLGESDFLTVARGESDETLRLGAPTERLTDAAVRSMPGMVMQKFHNLAGNTEVPHRFYEIRGLGPHRRVVLTAPMMKLAVDEQANTLAKELEARWSIVETSWAAGIGPSLVSEGVAVDLDLGVITDRHRRKSVTGVTPAVIGFQHGRCLICDNIIGPDDVIAVDHVFPHSFMRRGVLDVDVDVVWNLAPAHKACNDSKSSRPPTEAEKLRLAKRNEAIMNSPHPLRKTLELSLRSHGFRGRAGEWWPFVCRVLGD